MGGVGVNVMEWNPAVSCDLMELGFHAAGRPYETLRVMYDMQSLFHMVITKPQQRLNLTKSLDETLKWTNSFSSDTYSTSRPLRALKAPSSMQLMWFLSSWLRITQKTHKDSRSVPAEQL